jgi:AAT family amino acid transporter
MVLVLIGIDHDARVSLYGVPLWAVLLVLGHRVLRRRDPAAFARRPHLAPAPAHGRASGADGSGSSDHRDGSDGSDDRPDPLSGTPAL